MAYKHLQTSLIGALAASAIVCGSASAALYDSNGFENPPFSLGNIAGQDNSTGAWTNAVGTSSQKVIQNSVVDSGSQSLRITSVSGASATRELLRKSFASAFTDTEQVYSFRFRVDDAAKLNATASLLTFRGNTGSGATSTVFRVSNNGTMFLNGSSSSVAYLSNTWQDVQIALDLSPVGATGYTLTVGSNSVSGTFNTDYVNIASFEWDLQAAANQTANWYVDDFVVAVPEPAGVAALAAAGLLCMLRRRGA